MTQLLCIATIGRTGAEIVLSELAQNPNLALIPGQNFSGSSKSIYRPHIYDDLNPSEIFDMLSQHCFSRIGNKAWHGLTKHMKKDQLKKYLNAGHKTKFLKEWRGKYDFPNLVIDFVKSYFESMEITDASVNYYGFLSGNIPTVILASEFNKHEVCFLDWTASPSLWLSLISDRILFNPALALKFWIVSKLSFRLFEKEYGGKYISASLDSYINQPKKTIKEIETSLGVNKKDQIKLKKNFSGFIDINFQQIKNLKKNSIQIQKVLDGYCLFELANTFYSWVDDFLDTNEGISLVERYREYWKSTSHIAFDLSSPAEDDIIKLLLQNTGIQNKTNVSFKLFHEKISMDSRNFYNPSTTISHSWGSLEDELVIPCTPYYLRSVILYLDAILNSFNYDPWTFNDLRENRIYLRLLSKEYQDGFKNFGLEDLRVDLEKKIDNTNAKYLKTHALNRDIKKINN